MSFERYQPSEKGSESEQRLNHRNGQGGQVKYAPVKLVPNKSGQGQARNYPYLNLRFQPAEVNNHRQDPTVTIPLSFLHQLVQQAYSNKQLRTINNSGSRSDHEENQRSPRVVKEIITQIQRQEKQFKPMQQQDEEKKIQKSLLDRQMQFLQKNSHSRQAVEEYFIENPNLKPHFHKWLEQTEVRAIEDMLLMCSADPKPQQYQDLFKQLFQKISVEYYTKHAYAQIMREHDLNDKEKLKYLSVAAEILGKIAKPQEYFYFGRPQR